MSHDTTQPLSTHHVTVQYSLNGKVLFAGTCLIPPDVSESELANLGYDLGRMRSYANTGGRRLNLDIGLIPTPPAPPAPEPAVVEPKPSKKKAAAKKAAKKSSKKKAKVTKKKQQGELNLD